MQRIYFSLGSNIGNRKENLQAAINALAGYGQIIEMSSVYETPPQNFDSENMFYNLCLALEYKDLKTNWKKIIFEIEKNIGRVHQKTYTDRIIDIDVLFILPQLKSEIDLEIPHPRMNNRDFVIFPLIEIENSIKDDEWKKEINQWKLNLPKSKISKVGKI